VGVPTPRGAEIAEGSLAPAAAIFISEKWFGSLGDLVGHSKRDSWQQATSFGLEYLDWHAAFVACSIIRCSSKAMPYIAFDKTPPK